MRRYALLLCATAYGGFVSQHERLGMKPCTELTPWFVKCIDVEAERAETDAVVGRPRVGLQELSGDRKRCNLQNKAHDRQGNEGIRIAIALFGLIRHNATAINFENMLLKPLLKYQDHAYSADVLLHTNVVDRINNPRGKEVNVELPGPDAWEAFRPCRYSVEDQGVIDYKLSPLIRSFRKTQLAGIHRTRSNIQQGREENSASLMNLLRALYSLRASGGLIRGHEVATGRTYDVVVSARVDTIFTREVPGATYAYVHRSPVAKLFVPHFGCSVNTELLLNDRFAVGEREAMVHVYLPRIETLRKHKKEHEDSNRHVFNARSRRERTRRNGPALPPKLLSGERHLFDTVQAHGVPTARIPQFCLRRVRAGGLIWVKVFTSLDSHECPLEKLDHCDERCMERQPSCVAGRGCHQRGVNMHARFFDGEDWCNLPDASERHPTCLYDWEGLGLGWMSTA